MVVRFHIFLNSAIVILLSSILLFGCSGINIEPLPAFNFLGKKWSDVQVTLHMARQIEIDSQSLSSHTDESLINDKWKAPPLSFKLPSPDRNRYTIVEVCEYTIPRYCTTYTRCWLLLITPDGIIIAQRPQLWGDVKPPKMPNTIFARPLACLSEQDLIEIARFGQNCETISHTQNIGWLLPDWPINMKPGYDNTALNIITEAWRRATTGGGNTSEGVRQ